MHRLTNKVVVVVAVAVVAVVVVVPLFLQRISFFSFLISENPRFHVPGLTLRCLQLLYHAVAIRAMKKNLGWLGYIGDYTAQLYRDYNKPV